MLLELSLFFFVDNRNSCLFTTFFKLLRYFVFASEDLTKRCASVYFRHLLLFNTRSSFVSLLTERGSNRFLYMRAL